jgi:tetratricopeptide (TPR) repeat protein
VIELKPSDPNGYIGASAVLLRARKLEAARAHAELAARFVAKLDVRSRALAHEMLTRIALAGGDAEAARREAQLAREADPALPMPAFVEARLLYDEGKYEEALPLFERALGELQKSRAARLAELHYDAADTFRQLGRQAEAEAQLVEELRDFPQNTRACADLATLYHATDRAGAAADVIAAMMRETPTPDAYALAAHLWTTFGNARQAKAVRAEALRAFPPLTPSRAHSLGR